MEFNQNKSERTQASYIISEIVNSHDRAADMLDAITSEAEMCSYHEISTELYYLAEDFAHVILNTEDEFVTLVEDANGNYSVYIPSGESFATDYINLLYNDDCLFYSYEI